MLNVFLCKVECIVEKYYYSEIDKRLCINLMLLFVGTFNMGILLQLIAKL